MTEGATLSRQIIEAAVTLIELMDGNVEAARQLWSEAFEEAERINSDQSLGDVADLEDWERAVIESAARFEQAIEARKKFRVVEGSTSTDSTDSD